MFDVKKEKLFKSEAVSKSNKTLTNSVFVNSALKKAVVTKSGNGAIKYSSTLDPFVDQFGVMGKFKAQRPFSEIEKDCETLWAENKLDAVKFSLYMRTITRKVKMFDGSVTSEPQKGGELKHESIMRMIWLSQKSPETFWKNLDLFVSLGSWHDVFTMMQYDLVYNGWEDRKLDWDKLAEFILNGLSNENTNNLVKKYLPQIKAKSACKTVDAQANCLIGKFICSKVFGCKDDSYANYKQYRKLKTSGNAHDWQKLISQRKFDQIDFGKIHGRALNLLVRSKFLKNQGLTEKYSNWVSSDDVSVKYTGFVHELFGNLPVSLSGLQKHEQDTINKQFNTLVEKAKDDRKENQCNFIVVRDTSCSMSSLATGTKVSCFNIAKALALYFSEFLTGRFANAFIEFNSNAKMHTWSGNTPLEKWYNDRSSYIGSTNFLSVINLFATLKQSGIDESEFPTGILCISDSEFNPSSLNTTNVESAKKILLSAGFSKDFVSNFQIVLWNLQSSYYGKGTGEKFETTSNEMGTYYFSGYSASVISFIVGKEILTPKQLFDAAMNQEVLSKVKL